MLYRWLRDDEIRRAVPVTLTPTPPRPGEMGAAFEVINAVVSNGIALGGLLVAVAAWRSSLPRAPRVRIRHGDTVVELDGTPDEIRRVVDALDPPADPQPQPQPTSQTDPQPQPQPQPTSQTDPQPQPQPRTDPQPQPQPTSQTDPQPRTDRE